MDDQISEAIPVLFGSTTPGQIDTVDDVDMYQITLTAGETIGIDIDSVDAILDGGLDSALNIFDSTGALLLQEDDGRGPGIEYSQFESFALFTAPVTGDYFIGVSTFDNFSYDPITGTGDVDGETTGDYSLIIDAAPDFHFFLVNTTGDLPDANIGDGLAEDVNGDTSLRAVIQELNAIGGDSSVVEVDFDIDEAEIDPATSRFLISPTAPLPAIEQSVRIDTTNLFGGAFPQLQIDGSGVSGAGIDGIRVTGDGVVLSGIVVSNFSGDGLDFAGASSSFGEELLVHDNGGNGVRIVNSDAVVVAFSQIYDNGESGIQVAGASSSNLFLGNDIGLRQSITGAVAAPNGSHGIFLLAPNNDVIDNVVGGNTGVGINIATASATGNVLQSNFIGTDGLGNAIGNGSHGVLIRSANNVVGASDPFSSNVISGNGQSGLVISGTTAVNNLVLGNFLGTDRNGTSAIPNNAYGVLIRDASDNTIGGPNTGDGNVISGNGASGVILNVGASNNTIQGNHIGVNEPGFAALPNGTVGVYIRGGSTNNTIDRNVIAGNTDAQVLLVGLPTTGNVLTSNSIGLGVDTGPIAGGSTSILVRSPGNTIGGLLPSEANFISGPATATGIVLSGPAARDNVILGNAIGSNALEDGGDFGVRTGIRLTQGARDNTIGPANTIANNTDDAIWATSSSGEGNTFTQNSIFNNGFGIDVGAGGANANDDLDPDSGANRLQNNAESLIVNGVFNAAGLIDLSFDYFINSHPSNAAYPLTVEFFNSVDGQGQDFYTSDIYTVADFNAGGKTFMDVLDPNDFDEIAFFGTATVTDADGNTSEFSAPVPIDYDFGAVAATSMTNPVIAADVNGTGDVTPLDALLVLNVLSENASASGEFRSQSQYMVDTNGDGDVTPDDVLRVLNYLSDEASQTPAFVADSFDDADEDEEVDVRQWDLALVGVTDLF